MFFLPSPPFVQGQRPGFERCLMRTSPAPTNVFQTRMQVTLRFNPVKACRGIPAHYESSHPKWAP
jgi:hypothetical protein